MCDQPKRSQCCFVHVSRIIFKIRAQTPGAVMSPVTLVKEWTCLQLLPSWLWLLFPPPEWWLGSIRHWKHLSLPIVLLWTTRKMMEDSIIGIKIHGGAMEEPDLSLKDLQPHNFIDSSRSWPQGKLWMLGMLPGDVDEWIYSTLHYSAWIFGTSISHLTLKQQISPTDVRCEIPVLDKNSSVGWIW